MAFQYMQIKHPLAFEHAFHVPNGGHRRKSVAAKLKAEGVKAGVPDICITLSRGGYHALWIEMKAKRPHSSSVSVYQKAWLLRLEKAGYKATVCRGFPEFRAVIDEYMAMNDTGIVID